MLKSCAQNFQQKPSAFFCVGVDKLVIVTALSRRNLWVRVPSPMPYIFILKTHTATTNQIANLVVWVRIPTDTLYQWCNGSTRTMRLDLGG